MELRFNDPDLKVKGVTLRFLRDGKIVVKLGDGSIHYTLHPGRASGVIDLHKTDERFLDTDPLRHETLALLPKAAVEGSLRAIGPHLVAEFMNLWQPLRLGWMIRRRLGIGLRLPAKVELQPVDKISIKKGPAHCAEPFASRIKPPEFYEEVLQNPSAAFLLFDCRRRSLSPYGAMVTYRGHLGHVQMKWAKFRDLRRWAAKWEPVLLASWEQFRENGPTREVTAGQSV